MCTRFYCLSLIDCRYLATCFCLSYLFYFSLSFVLLLSLDPPPPNYFPKSKTSQWKCLFFLFQEGQVEYKHRQRVKGERPDEFWQLKSSHIDFHFTNHNEHFSVLTLFGFSAAFNIVDPTLFLETFSSVNLCITDPCWLSSYLFEFLPPSPPAPVSSFSD